MFTLNKKVINENNDRNSNPKKKQRETKITKNTKPVHTRFNIDDKSDDLDKKENNDDDNDTFENNILFLIGLGPPNKGPVKFVYNENDSASQTIQKSSCNNPLCDHKTFEEDSTLVDIPLITNISHVEDLIKIGKSYHCKKHTEFAGMDLKLLCNLVTPLVKLNDMIGMKIVKEHIVDQILFFLQGHYKKQKCNNCAKCTFNQPCLNIAGDMMHTVIAGSPGTGKTELGKLMGELYKEMGILSKGTFKSVSRADLIGEYLGHTAMKTQKVIDECTGGVLFIDEAYSLGNAEGRDSFSKECIDTLNRNLSEKRDLLCIIAGYKDQLDKCFFKYNEGLNRRFTFRYEITPYNHEELFRIFELKVRKNEWQYDIKMQHQLLKLFEENIKAFPNYGGDIETLFFKCQIIHSRRCVFDSEERKILSYDDIEKGLKMLLAQRGESNETIKEKQKNEELAERINERKREREEIKKEEKEQKEKEEQEEEQKERAKRQKKRDNVVNIY